LIDSYGLNGSKPGNPPWNESWQLGALGRAGVNARSHSPHPNTRFVATGLSRMASLASPKKLHHFSYHDFEHVYPKSLPTQPVPRRQWMGGSGFHPFGRSGGTGRIFLFPNTRLAAILLIKAVREMHDEQGQMGGDREEGGGQGNCLGLISAPPVIRCSR